MNILTFQGNLWHDNLEILCRREYFKLILIVANLFNNVYHVDKINFPRISN